MHTCVMPYLISRVYCVSCVWCVCVCVCVCMRVCACVCVYAPRACLLCLAARIVGCVGGGNEAGGCWWMVDKITNFHMVNKQVNEQTTRTHAQANENQRRGRRQVSCFCCVPALGEPSRPERDPVAPSPDPLTPTLTLPLFHGP